MAKKENTTVEEMPEMSTKAVQKKEITSVEELPGVGPKTAEKLAEAGYGELMSIATASAAEIAVIADLGDGTAAKIILEARNALNLGYETGLSALEKRKNIGKLSTGSKELNALLGGGIETQAITECYGAFGSGKTQMSHQLSVNAQLPKDQGGLDGGVLFIDTENTFRPERIQQMAAAAGLDPEKVLGNIHVGRAYNSDHQILLLEKAKDVIRENNIKLVIVDSITSQFRSDYVGRGTLANRQQKLNQHMHALQKFADTFNLAVYITNQVMSRPDMLFGDPTAPIGGNIVGHQSTFRIYLRKSKGDLRIAKLVDSPNLPDGEAIFKVTTDGIKDKE